MYEREHLAETELGQVDGGAAFVARIVGQQPPGTVERDKARVGIVTPTGKLGDIRLSRGPSTLRSSAAQRH